MDETVSFNVQVVPEFPAMVATVMAVSIVMIVVMAKTLGYNNGFTRWRFLRRVPIVIV